MSLSPIDRLHPVLHELWMPDDPDLIWKLHRWQGVEGLSTPYTYDLELSTESSFETCEGAVGAKCELLLDRNGLARVRYGVLEHIEIEASAGAGAGVAAGVGHHGVRMRARMVPAFKLLDQGSDTRFFAGKTVIDILREVLEPALADYGREVDVESYIKGDYNARDYCVQFRESTFAFCSRLMEEEGIAYFFAPNDDEQVERLVLIDNNADYQDAELLIPGPLPIVLDRSDQFDRESLQALEWRHSKTPNRVLTRGYNRRAPSEFDEGEAEREDPQHPSVREHFLDGVTRQIVDDPVDDPRAESFTGTGLDQRSALAERIHDRYALEARGGSGRSNVIGFRAGGIFTLGEHPLESLAAHEFLLTLVRHSSPSEGSYSNEFECIPRELAFRPARTTPRPLVHGIQTGVVVGPALDEVYTDPTGRIRVKFHGDRHSADDHEASCWIPVAQIWAGQGFGAQVIPRVGMEVVVAFVDGNPDCPIVTGCVYNGTNQPPYELPANSTKSTFKSQSSPGGDGFNELRFEDAHGSEQVFIHAQRRMDVRVRGSLYETSGGSREERIGWERGDDRGGDHNITVKRDVNHHVEEIRYTKIEKKQYETVVEDVIEDFQAKRTVLVGDTSQLSAPKVVVEASDHISHKAGEIKLSGSSAIHLKGGGKVAIESNNAIELKVGGSFISITPGGIAIQGVTVRINSGGGVGSAGDADAAEAVEMLDPLDALAADTGRPHSGGGGGGGGRTRIGRRLEPHRAPPMEPPPPPTPGQPSVLPDGTLRQFLTIEWVELETWCSEPATLRGTTQGYTDGDTESAEIRNTSDGAVQRAVTLRITSNAYTHNVDVVDLLPRRAGTNYESERTLDAVAVGQTTPTAIRLRFIPNLAQARCTTGRARFSVTVTNYVAEVGGTINYVPGWLRFCMQLDATVPAGTGGDIGLAFAVNAAHEYSGGGWRYAQRTRAGSMQYWNGAAWTNVPVAWTQRVGVRNRLLDMAIWREGTTDKTQYGTLAWPGTVPAWGPTETALAARVLPQWTAQINATWTDKFDLKRQECRSTEPQCCRYKTRCRVTFNQTATKGTGIVLAGNSGRSEANVWSLVDTTAMPSHEFGHHLGNPDEYAGAGVDTSLNGDGAVNGIDANSIMGQNMTTVKRRHYTTICQHLATMVGAQVNRSYTYQAVPVV